MRTLMPATLAALESGSIIVRDFVVSHLPGGPVGFWSGTHNVTVDGQAYLGRGGLFEIRDPVMSRTGLVAEKVTVRFSGIDPDVLATFDNETYHQRRVDISIGQFNPDGSLISLDRWFAGVMDTAERIERARGEAILDVICESRTRGLFRSGDRTRSDADQRNHAGAPDGFFAHVTAAVTTKTYWGRRGPQ